MNEYTGQKVSTFRERFSQLCDESPNNATEIADALHVSKATVSSWKSGDRSPKQPTVITIAEYFLVNVAWLMGFDVEKEAPKEDNEYRMPSFFSDSQKMLKFMQAMPVEDYKAFIDILRRAEQTLKERGEL